MKVKQNKAKLLTCKYANTKKKELIYSVFNFVYNLKNEMSEFCFDNYKILLENKTSFISNYKNFNNDIIDSHTTQTLFTDICNLYINHIQQLTSIKIQHIFIQDKINIKNQKCYVLKKSTILSNFLRYCIKSFIYDIPENPKDLINKLSKINTKTARIFLEYYESKSDDFKVKFHNLLLSYINSIFNDVKLIKFKNGSFRLTTSGYSFRLIYDDQNSKFKWFLKLKLRKKEIYLPILENKKYFKFLNTEAYRKQIFLIDRRNISSSKKLYFSIIKEEELKFDEKIGKILGIDININKETFITSSDNFYIKYSDGLFENLINEIEKIDKIGYQNINRKELIKFNKLIKKFKWYVIYDLSKFLNYCIHNNITDIVMEDLNINYKIHGKLKIKNKAIKTSRFIRLLGLSNIKNIFMNMCHNKGIKVHLIPPAYTSQQCSKCGFISEKNRLNQSNFKCLKCNYKCNADLNASINIKDRFLFKSYREKLLKLDKIFPEFRPRKLDILKIKEILEKNVSSHYQTGSLYHQVLPEIGYSYIFKKVK